MFDKLTVEDGGGKIANKVMLQKYLAYNNLSLLFQAKRFFSTQPEGKFILFPGFRKLRKDSEERKEKKKKTILVRNFNKLSVQKEEEDMKTLAKYSDGSLRIHPPDSSFKSVLFKLEDPVCSIIR